MKGEATPFPWDEAMKFGFGILRLSPSQFWALSVRELDAAMRMHFGERSQTISRQWLEAAMADNPDAGHDERMRA